MDRIARTIAAQALRREVRPWAPGLFGALWGGVSLFNARPRPTLNYKTPAQALNEYLAHHQRDAPIT